eukprot:1668196-Heterocapsa_arctica.AAC.1
MSGGAFETRQMLCMVAPGVCRTVRNIAHDKFSISRRIRETLSKLPSYEFSRFRGILATLSKLPSY